MKLYLQGLISTGVLIVLMLLGGCSGGVDGGISGTGDGSTQTYAGAAQKGPFLSGSAVTIGFLAADGTSTDTTISTQTSNSLGAFQFTTEKKGPALISVEGFHLNELTGRLSDSTLRIVAVTHVDGQQQVFVNLMTHLIHGRVLKLMSDRVAIDTAVAQAQSELITSLEPVFGPANIRQFTNLSLYNVDGTIEDSNAYLLLLSASFYQVATLLANENSTSLEASLTALLNATLQDLATDGDLDDLALLELLTQAIPLLNAGDIRDNLQDQSQVVLGSRLGVPDITRYMQQLLLTYPASDSVITEGGDIRVAVPAGLTGITLNLYIDGVKVDTLTEAPWTFQWSPYFWTDTARHTLLVEAVGQNGASINSNLITVTVDPSAQGDLTLLTPANGSIQRNNRNISLSWGGLTRATTYDIEVYSSDGMTLLDTYTQPGNTLGLTLSEGTYHWRVRAKNLSEKTGPWTEKGTFSIEGPAAPGSLSSDINPITETEFDVTLNWGDSENADHYEVEVSPNESMTSATQESVPGQSFNLTLTTGGYYWRVRAISGEGFVGPWTEAQPVAPGLYSWVIDDAANNAYDFAVIEQGFVIASMRQVSSSTQKIHLQLRNFSGELQWEKLIVGALAEDRSLAIDASGNILLAYLSKQNPDINYPDFSRNMLVSYTPEGQQRWQVTASAAPTAVSPAYTSLITLNGQIEWITAVATGADTFNYQAQVVNADGSLDPATILNLSGLEHVVIRKAIATRDGNIALAGSYEYGWPAGNLFVTKLNSTGSVISQNLDHAVVLTWDIAFLHESATGNLITGNEAYSTEQCIREYPPSDDLQFGCEYSNWEVGDFLSHSAAAVGDQLMAFAFGSGSAPALLSLNDQLEGEFTTLPPYFAGTSIRKFLALDDNTLAILGHKWNEASLTSQVMFARISVDGGAAPFTLVAP